METMTHNRITDIQNAESFLKVMIRLRNAFMSKDSDAYHRIIDDLYRLIPPPDAETSSLLTLKEVAGLTGRSYQFIIKKARNEWRYATVYKNTRLMFYEKEIPKLIQHLNNEQKE